MDLGIEGRRALVCAASRGLGRACAESLAREGADVTITGRTESTLNSAADMISRATGRRVVPVVGDITTAEGRAAALAACPDPDILVNNAGGPPPGNFRDFSREDWIRALEANMLTALELIRATVDQMIERKWGRVVNITSASVKAPIPILLLSNGARAGLTGAVGTIARETGRHNVTINNLLPGPFATDRLMATLAVRAKTAGLSVEEFAARESSASTAGRFGDPFEFGEACAFLCSSQAGYINAQNILLDGGAFPGTF
jgi:3-oxoacyl-[acyl-carrier protein] reductase